MREPRYVLDVHVSQVERDAVGHALVLGRGDAEEVFDEGYDALGRVRRRDYVVERGGRAALHERQVGLLLHAQARLCDCGRAWLRG